jgi:integrase
MLPEVKEAFVQQMEYKQLFNIDDSYSIRRFDKDNNYIGMCKGFIFTTSKGTIATEESLNRTIKVIVNEYNRKESKKACEEGRDSQLLPTFTIHCTRHSFASYRKNMRGRSVAAIMGHCKEETANRIYIHPDFDTLKNDMEKALGA